MYALEQETYHETLVDGGGGGECASTDEEEANLDGPTEYEEPPPASPVRQRSGLRLRFPNWNPWGSWSAAKEEAKEAAMDLGSYEGMSAPRNVGDYGDEEGPKTYCPPDPSSMMLDQARKQNFLKRNKDRLLKFVREHPARALYYLGGALITVVFLYFLCTGETARQHTLSIILPGSADQQAGGDTGDQDQDFGHLKDRAERLYRLGPWTDAQLAQVRLKQFASGREYSEDRTMNTHCEDIFPSEITAGMLTVHGQKPPRGYDHVVVSIADVLRVQTDLAERLAQKAGNPTPAVFVAPKAWAGVGDLIHPSFNPCLITMRSRTGIVTHWANPELKNEELAQLYPARVNLTKHETPLEWSPVDFFVDPFPSLKAPMYHDVHIFANDPVTSEQVYSTWNITRADEPMADMTFGAQFWIHALYNSAQWKDMLLQSNATEASEPQ